MKYKKITDYWALLLLLSGLILMVNGYSHMREHQVLSVFQCRLQLHLILVELSKELI